MQTGKILEKKHIRSRRGSISIRGGVGGRGGLVQKGAFINLSRRTEARS